MTRSLAIAMTAMFGISVAMSGCQRNPSPSETTAPAAPAAEAPVPADAQAIAKEAYVYGFPMVDSYRIQYSYLVDTKDPEYKGGWNQVHSIARVFTPDDKAVQTPNSDTPYSFLGYDLRAEPLVLTVPKIDKNRYYSVQFIDLYTQNFAYLGSRTSGNAGTTVLLAGPDWSGETPKGIDQVIRSETQLGNIIFRTQLFGPDDLENVKKVQAGYKVQPLSAFLGQPAPPAAPPIDFIKPLTAQQEHTSPEFFEILNFLLRYSPTVPSETALMQRFGTLGIGPDKTFDADKLSPATLQAVKDGMADAWKAHEEQKARLDRGEITSGDLFGNREQLKGNYLNRMLAATSGIYGNTREEAIYPVLSLDSNGQPLSGANKYVVRFAPGQLPPVNAFWSLTMYEMPASLLVANPIKRYLINSTMLSSLKRDADGGITLYVQNESPGKEREANWLPAPKGPFVMAMRLYWPKNEALDGTWKAPKAERVQ